MIKYSFLKSGGMNNLKRELQATLKSNIENYGGEIFLSQDLAINLLLISKKCYHRCKQVFFYIHLLSPFVVNLTH